MRIKASIRGNPAFLPYADNMIGEHQPVYDEFGSILLLVLVFRQHFNLPESELGISYTDSFILKYIRRGCISRDPSELSEQEKMLLGGWIKGLFETEGISDELMSTCSPQDFYLLVATLFDQSLKACEAGVLGLETLKGGFECKYRNREKNFYPLPSTRKPMDFALDLLLISRRTRSARTISASLPDSRSCLVYSPSAYSHIYFYYIAVNNPAHSIPLSSSTITIV